MKLQSERKKLAVEGAKLAAGVAVCVVLYVAASSWAGSAENGKNQATAQLSQQTSEIATLRAKIDNSGDAQKIYADVVEERKNEDFTIDNEKVRTVLQDLIILHRLSINDKLEYSSDKEFKHPELTTVTTPMIVRQDAKLRFQAISDLQVYAFMHSLSHKLPGIVRFTKFRLTRKSPFDNGVLVQIASGGAPHMVEAEIAFDWFAFKPEASDETEASPEATPEAGGMQ